MKRIVIGLLALVLLMAAFLSGHSQQPPAPKVLQHTKVGVVNMGAIYTQWSRVKEMKAVLDREMEPYNAKKNELEKIVKEWQAIAAAVDDNFSPETRSMAKGIVLESKRQMEDLDVQVKKKIGKKVDDMLVVLDRGIQKAIAKCAATQDYHVILAYGEPETPLEDLVQFKRRMTVIDKGGVAAVYVSKEIDVSTEILKTLENLPRE